MISWAWATLRTLAPGSRTHVPPPHTHTEGRRGRREGRGERGEKRRGIKETERHVYSRKKMNGRVSVKFPQTSMVSIAKVN